MLPKPQPGILSIVPYKGGLSKAGEAKQVMKLSSNESPLGASPKAIAAYQEAAQTLHRYPDGSATLLREAIGEVYNLNPERIVCGAGSDEIISFLCQAYAGPGDEVLYSQHGFLMYPIYARVAGATPVQAPEKDLSADVDALLAAVTDKTRIVFLANPNNPTGTCLMRKDLVRLRKGLREDILLVIDGAYAEYVDDKDYTAGEDLVRVYDNVVMTRTFSKIYGLAALRIGWGYCPGGIAEIINRVRGPFNVSTPAMMAATAAVKDTEFTQQARTYNMEWRQWLTAELTALGLTVVPSYANFLLMKFPEGERQAGAANQYLMERGIIPRQVANYGLPEYLRLSVGLEGENKAVIEALKGFMA